MNKFTDMMCAVCSTHIDGYNEILSANKFGDSDMSYFRDKTKALTNEIAGHFRRFLELAREEVAK